MTETVIRIRGVKKKYRLGQINSGTLSGDLKAWWAKVRGKEDPNAKIWAQQADSRTQGQDFWALNGIDLDVHKGEALGIIGCNGAGKSTLLKLLARITAPTEGEIAIKGRIASMLEVGTGFNQEMTGRENIYMNGAILGMTRDEVTAKLDEIIAFSECGEFIDTPVKRYSSGMYVKLAFAVAAHLDSEIMIMDEVLAVGDVQFQKKCLGKMSDAAHEDSKTVLYVSHNMATIRQLCTRCVVLKEGRIIYDGEVEEAIRIYSDDAFDFELSNDLSGRPVPNDVIPYARMTRIAVVGKQDLVYRCGEPVRLELTWTAAKPFAAAGLNVVIKKSDGTPIGFCASENDLHAEAPGEYKTRFSLATNMLPGGKYFVDLSFGKLENGGILYFDGAVHVMGFEIAPDMAVQRIGEWHSVNYGYVILPPIALDGDGKQTAPRTENGGENA